MSKFWNFAKLVLTIGAAASCFNATYGQDQKGAPNKASSTPKDETLKRITPFLLVEKRPSVGNFIPANTYTKLQIVGSEIDGEVLNYAKRNSFFRAGIGKKYSFVSLLKAESGYFKDAIPLITREYESSSKVGEVFGRKISADKLDFPYFLSGVDSASRVGRFTLTANMVETSSSQISSLSLTFLRDSLKAIAPSTGLLTTLTKDSSENIANMIDQQANMLFATKAGEEISFDLPLNEAVSYDLTIFGPKYELDSIMNNNDGKKIGKWSISFSAPRPSAFSALICDGASANPCNWRAAYDDAITRPGSVLAFKLVNRIDDLGTIAAYLLHKEWWAQDMVDLEKASTATEKKHAQFCRKIRDAVTELGFNELDGRIVATAVSKSGLVSDKIKTGLEGQNDCKYG